MDKEANSKSDYTWELKSKQELRIEIDKGQAITLKLITGTCELYGAELGTNKEYCFSESKIAIFTWVGCCIKAEGSLLVEYVADNSPMPIYLNSFLAIENLRVESERVDSDGPRVLLAGPVDSGKTSLSKILLNYSMKLGREPIFVDLDPSEGSLSMPGTLSATSMKHFVSIEHGFSNLSNLAPPSLKVGSNASTPLVYYFGETEPKNNLKLYSILTEKIANNIQQKSKINKTAKYSGCIVDTSGLVDKVGTNLLIDIVKKMKINIVFVIGQERLYSELVKMSTKENLKTEYIIIPKSGGVISRETTYLKRMQQTKIKHYFYGCPINEYSPSTLVLSFAEIQIFRIGAGSLAPSSALPIGHERKVTETRIVKVDPGDILLHSILAVSVASSVEDVLSSNIFGFVYVSDVDEDKQKITVLTPSSGKLPSNLLIMGSFKWIET